jgi:hypothetical protein
MGVLRGPNVGIVLIAFLFGAYLASIQNVLAANKKILTPTCQREDGSWLPEGASCGPPSLGGTCQRLGNGTALTCRPGATK